MSVSETKNSIKLIEYDKMEKVIFPLKIGNKTCNYYIKDNINILYDNEEYGYSYGLFIDNHIKLKLFSSKDLYTSEDIKNIYYYNYKDFIVVIYKSSCSISTIYLYYINQHHYDEYEEIIDNIKQFDINDIFINGDYHDTRLVIDGTSDDKNLVYSIYYKYCANIKHHIKIDNDDKILCLCNGFLFTKKYVHTFYYNNGCDTIIDKLGDNNLLVDTIVEYGRHDCSYETINNDGIKRYFSIEDHDDGLVVVEDHVDEHINKIIELKKDKKYLEEQIGILNSENKKLKELLKNFEN